MSCYALRVGLHRSLLPAMKTRVPVSVDVGQNVPRNDPQPTSITRYTTIERNASRKRQVGRSAVVTQHLREEEKEATAHRGSDNESLHESVTLRV